ncbi:beta-ketoacyl-ACP synthase III [Chitinophaga pinensis]|uniref:3-Oxoacyl-(Acyl-carrier-protein (ACP)) synthase III domain protein n=1 Tax=Chitinophaga pinensis (strain ATCC 43595 / DSM 2588 / LMG 13176 / NBRC 15968 / NCIMB 11800 / UQM 2034) TaxID=485918 RepID=A0A979G2I8_CHIPD|nr:beta-ketoacyl-ACP synthase III [Chitinophaga pinensis]ACU59665.1 3-Oxoacyl-(acyl-carrier-protein (ACP)) synthase III domain protein [Chitinophaga pinensis DSM 2588]
MHKVFITATGKFLPNTAIPNEAMEDYLGRINGQSSRTKDIFLRKNGIKSRYYALDTQQQTTHQAYEMASKAIDDCLEGAAAGKQNIDFLSTATTQSDLPVPGFASMVQGESGIGTCTLASHQSVCAASIMAIQNAYMHVQAGQSRNAVSCAAELPSRMFKASRFAGQSIVGTDAALPADIDFLRWMLSDGAGAMLLQPVPSRTGVSLEIEWIDLRSYAHQYDLCMYTGTNKQADGSISKTWLDYESMSAADKDGAINLKQDMQLVDNIVKLGIQRFFELVDEKKIAPEAIDWLVCHYSSHHFKKQITDLLEKGGADIPAEKWFTNLYTVGNIGSASIFVMLDELLHSGKLKHGQQVLCMVPESGRFITGYMMLRVVAPAAPGVVTEDIATIKAPAIRTQQKPVQEWLVRQLTGVWFDFERSLQQVPIVKRIFNGQLTLEEYKRLLLNLRQQVIDGSQWIARAASNVSMEYFHVRSSFIRHSSDEHRDYQILEKNYINCGGNEQDLYTGEKNIGSEALSAYMFQRASQPDPFDLLGGMFIIEGLGNRVSGKWGRAIQQQLQLNADQVSFFIYHESSDSNDNHFERFENAIQSDLLTQAIAQKIVKTAKVVARLYRMQLEELDNF